MTAHRRIAVALVGLLAFAPLAGCGQLVEAPASDQGEEQGAKDLKGIWTISTQANSADALGKDDRELFERAASTCDIYQIEPKLLLGRQIVSGTNSAFLCFVKSDQTDYESWAIAVVYEDLEGAATIASVNKLDLARLHFIAHPIDEQPLGGWELAYPSQESLMSEDEEPTATDAMTEGGYVPVAMLATQEDGGETYQMALCWSGSDASGKGALWYVCVAPTTADAAAELLDVQALDLLAYV